MELKAQALGLDFEPISAEVPGGTVSCDEAWRGCQCFRTGQMNYTLSLELFWDDGRIIEDTSFTCVNCELPLDLEQYLMAGGVVFTQAGSELPVRINWESKNKGGPMFDECEIWGEVTNG
jgi:hypothetical protein